MECPECGEEVDELFKVEGARKRVCEECAERIQEEQEIAAEATGAMRNMMEYKGR